MPHQVSANCRTWEPRRASIDTDQERDPERIRHAYALQTHRLPGAHRWGEPARTQKGKQRVRPGQALVEIGN
ncbi:MAG: hypothetical protein ACK5Q7_14340 [Cyanobacteriota bacterium]